MTFLAHINPQIAIIYQIARADIEERALVTGISSS